MLMIMGSLHDLEIRHLMALRTVAAERSFGRAANVLGYTQSAISQQIASLEKIVGGQVFDRPGGPRPVDLTPLGRMLLTHADLVAAQIDAAETDLEGYRQGTEGTLAVGTFQSVSVRLLPLVLQRFRELRPRVSITLFENDDEQVLVDKLAEGSLDVSFLATDLGSDGIDSQHLLEDPFVLLSPPSAPLSEFDSVPATLLSGAPLLSQSDTACQRLVDDGLRGMGVDLNVVFRATDNAAVQALVRAGMGHAVMPLMAVDRDDPAVLFQRLDPGIPPRRLRVGTPSHHTTSPAATLFCDIAIEVGAAMEQAALALA